MVQKQVRAVLEEMIEAQNTGDEKRIRAVLSERPDAIHIGSDPGEWMTSKEVADAVAAFGGGIQMVGDSIDIHGMGDVAWAEGRGRFTAPGGAERPMRWTCVLTHEDGGWRIVQSHASIGVPNAEIFR